MADGVADEIRHHPAEPGPVGHDLDVGGDVEHDRLVFVRPGTADGRQRLVQAQPLEVETLLAGIEPGQLQELLDQLRQARHVLHQQRRRRTGRRRQRVELLAEHPRRRHHGRQRCAQLVGHVGCELPFTRLALRHLPRDLEIGDARFNGHAAVRDVHVEHAIEPRETDDDAAGDRHRAAGQPAAMAARHKRHVVPVAQAHDFLDVLRG